MPARFSRGAPLRTANRRPCGDDQYPTPVRRVVTRRTKKVVGLFPSRKTGAMVPWESQVERDFLCLLEVDRAVAGFVAQPERLRLVVDGRPRQHVPDFLVRGHDGTSWLTEVKADEAAALPENRAVFAAAAEACLRRNVGYRVVLRSWIGREPRLSNAKLLLRYRDAVADVDLRIRAVAALEGGPAPLGELRRGLGGAPALRGIMALLLDGTLAADLDQPISDAWLVRLPDEGGRR